jgi:opacity protein-like surface antigen
MLGVAAGLAWLLAAAPAAAQAVAGEAAFARQTMILSVLIGGGAQNDVEDHGRISGITFLNLGYRMSYLPLDPVGAGWYRGAFEPGLEGWFQYYLGPESATAQGAKLAFRYNFLGLGGRLVPYVEALAGVGGTSLKVKEIRSSVTFVLEGGVGLQYLLTPTLAVHGGYRFQHISNGNVESPNRGFNSDAGVVGMSWFFR